MKVFMFDLGTMYNEADQYVAQLIEQTRPRNILAVLERHIHSMTSHMKQLPVPKGCELLKLPILNYWPRSYSEEGNLDGQNINFNTCQTCSLNPVCQTTTTEPICTGQKH